MLPCFCSRVGYHPAIVPRHKRVYAYKSCLFIPWIELKLNFFLYPVKEKVKEEKIADEGVLLSLSLSLYFIYLSLSLCRKSIGYRGNRVEIQESASLQLGSDVTKFRVAAAEVGRHFVSSSECRDFARENIVYRAYRAIYLYVVSLLFLFFFSLFLQSVKFCVASAIAKFVLSPGANWNFWLLFFR